MYSDKFKQIQQKLNFNIKLNMYSELLALKVRRHVLTTFDTRMWLTRDAVSYTHLTLPTSDLV